MFGSKFGIDYILWEIPLDQLHQLEHVHLWTEGAETQKKVKYEELEKRHKAIIEKWRANGSVL